MISFSNPGIIEPKLISTMGCNVKETDSPIGFFGTGLKYALAVLMREKQEVLIWAGNQALHVHCREEVLRGKSFSMVYMNDIPLGFTTELGKQWTLENAYRELYCNAVDEGGEVEVDREGHLTEGTVINVFGEAFDRVHATRGNFILAFSGKKKLFELSGVGEIWDAPGTQLFFKGIAVGEYFGGKAKYTYNVFSDIKLTEDRTWAQSDQWKLNNKLARLLGACSERSIVRNSLINNEGAERYFYFPHVELDSPFLDEVGEMIPSYRKDMNMQAKRRRIELSLEEQSMLEDASRFWSRLGWKVLTYPVVLVASIASGEGGRALALAEDETIWLTPECFGDRRILRLVLIEEYIHLSRGVHDETRDMQNVLFSMIEELGEKINGAG
jgi:hypothetical protein